MRMMNQAKCPLYRGRPRPTAPFLRRPMARSTRGGLLDFRWKQEKNEIGCRVQRHPTSAVLPPPVLLFRVDPISCCVSVSPSLCFTVLLCMSCHIRLVSAFLRFESDDTRRHATSLYRWLTEHSPGFIFRIPRTRKNYHPTLLFHTLELGRFAG